PSCRNCRRSRRIRGRRLQVNCFRQNATAGHSPHNSAVARHPIDRDGDAGTAAALEDALAQIAEGEGQRVIDMIDNAPPGPINTRWGPGFRDYEACMDYIRANGVKAPEGGLALPLPYTVYERPTYSVVPSNGLWRDPARADVAEILRKNEDDNLRRRLYFP